MTDKQIRATIDEATRFVAAATELLKVRQAWEYDCYPNNPREQGACRRASLDLTRSLAKMRSTK